jgi:hypothetical protein
MREKSFEYGPLSRGFYIALLWFIPLIVWHFPQWLWHYVGLLIFLGLLLRPLLEWSGCAVWLADSIERLDERLHRRSRDRHRRLIARRERDKKYRHTHRRDPRLPPNW